LSLTLGGATAAMSGASLGLLGPVGASTNPPSPGPVATTTAPGASPLSADGPAAGSPGTSLNAGATQSMLATPGSGGPPPAVASAAEPPSVPTATVAARTAPAASVGLFDIRSLYVVVIACGIGAFVLGQLIRFLGVRP
jgi:hypothetical protein